MLNKNWNGGILHFVESCINKTGEQYGMELYLIATQVFLVVFCLWPVRLSAHYR